jgi:fatty-acyl-CoA synthase
MEYTLGYLLKRSAWKFPDKTAIVFGDERTTYDQLNQRVNRLANALLGLGVKKGDKVASMLFNSSEIKEAYFRVAKIDIWASDSRSLAKIFPKNDSAVD